MSTHLYKERKGGPATGLPQLPTQPLSLGDLLGLTPGCDFGVCNPIGYGFLQEPVTDTAIGIAALLRGIAALGLLYEAPHPQSQLPPQGKEVICNNVGEFKDPSVDPVHKICYYSCSDGIGRNIAWPINNACPAIQKGPWGKPWGP